MLSIGWTEMMLVAAVALIVVGPKDLPSMLRQIGKAVGTVRRMGNDFKKELNKVTAVDELKDIKNSIAAPMTDVRKNIENEFNSIAPGGEVIPSGKIAPKDSKAQSVVEEIKSAAGIDGEAKTQKPAVAKPARKTRGVVSRSNKAKSASATVTSNDAETEAKETVAKETVVKPTKKRTTKKPAPRKRATAKKSTPEKTTTSVAK